MSAARRVSRSDPVGCAVRLNEWVSQAVSVSDSVSQAVRC